MNKTDLREWAYMFMWIVLAMVLLIFVKPGLQESPYNMF